MSDNFPQNEFGPHEFGPRSVGAYTVALRSLLGFAGGFAGSLPLLFVYLFAGRTIFENTQNPWSLLFFLIASFIFTLLVNLVSVWLQIFADRDKFFLARDVHLRRSLVINLITYFIFFLTYLWAFLFSPALMPQIFWIHFLVSAIISVLTLDALAGPTSAYRAIVGTLIGTFLGVALVSAISTSSFVVFLLLGLPLLWFALAMGNSWIEALGYQLYSLYGTDPFETRE